MEPLVSIITPVYKTEKYLRQCVDSILNQTFCDFELILVDDGSPDKCPEICDEYAFRDARVAVIHKSNGGISSARNSGLSRAKGRYLCFVDSDDYLDSDFLKTLLDAGEADIIVSGTRKVSEEGALLYEQKTVDSVLKSGDEIKEAYKTGTIGGCFMGPVAKLYRRSLAAELLFDEELIVAEDIVFNLNYLPLASSVCLLPYIGYNVREFASSTTNAIHRNYTVMFEHGYDIIDNKIREAKLSWGVLLPSSGEGSTALRYYLEMTNLVRSRSPYTKKEVLGKIRQIHSDQEFINPIRKAHIKHLSNAERISKISVILNMPFITRLIFKVMVALGK